LSVAGDEAVFAAATENQVFRNAHHTKRQNPWNQISVVR